MRRNKKGKGKLGKFIRRSLLVIGILLIYILVGGIAPFITQKEVSEDYKQLVAKTQYTSKDESVDRAAIIESSEDAMSIRLHMIGAAKEKILFSTFSMKPDDACRKVCAALYESAERGVKVELIIDGLSGSWDMKNDPMFYALGTHKNVTIKYYNFFYVYAPWTFNGRLHDKFIVIDDKQLLLGGRNTSNYFLGNYDQQVLSYDREVFVYNTSDTAKDSVIYQAQEYFQSLWDSNVSKVVYDQVPKSKRKKVKEARKAFVSLYGQIQKEQPDLFVDKVDYNAGTIPVNKITLVSNPIHIYSKEPQVWYTLEQLMLEAKEQVLIQSPYVVLNDSMYASLEKIGQDLDQYEVLLNGIAAGDNICASSDYKYSRKDVLKTGIDVYEFQGSHSTHNKSLVIDHEISVIGSYNLDMRSTYLDTETMLIIDGKEFARDLESKIKAMQEESIRINEDGSYSEDAKIEPRELSGKKKFLFSFLPFVLRPIRFLL